MAVGVLLLVLALGMLAASGVLLCALAKLHSVGELLVGVYVAGFAELVLLSLILSVPRALTTTTLLAALGAVLAATFVVWRWAGRPPPPAFRPAWNTALSVLSDPVLAVLAVGVGLALMYSVALGIFAPQVDSDSLAYHLPRAAFWRQQHAVAYISGGIDSRNNANPPVAEIGVLLTMLTAHDDRFVWLPQFLALPVSAVAVFCIARRIGLEPREAMLGALLFAALPVVLLQASTALNDLVVASFLLAATTFALRGRRRELALAGVALALAIGTKVSAFYALPLFGALLYLTQPRTRWRSIGSWAALAIVVGGGWYVLNRVETGSFIGGLFFSNNGGLKAPPAHYWQKLTSLGSIVSPARLGIEFAEVPGAVGRDRLFFVIAAAIVLVAVAGVRRGRRDLLHGAALAALVVLLPLLVSPFEHLVLRGWQKAWFELGRPDVGVVGSGRSVTVSSPLYSWFGPVGLLLVVLGAVVVVRELRHRGLGPLPVVFVVAPFAWLLMVGWTLDYNDFEGRLLVFPVALAASCWGVLFRFRAAVTALVAISLTTMLLALVHLKDRPPGISLLDPVPGPAVWHQSRARLMTGPGDEATVIDYITAHVPRHATIALPDPVDFLQYPYFGSTLSHRVLVGGAGAQARADAIVFDHGPPQLACTTCWRTALRYPSGWGLLVRTRRGPA